MKVMRYAGGLLISFFAAWTMAYALTWILRGDRIELRYYFDYLLAVLTLSGGEIIPLMLVITVALFIPLAIGAIWVVRKSTRDQG